MNTSSHVEQVLTNKGTAIDEEAALSAAPGEATEPGATREERIRLAAYAAAERRGFAPGFETDDWLEAERQVEQEDAAA